MSEPLEDHQITRGAFVDWVIYVCSAISAAALALPALAYLFPVTKSGPVKSREEVGDSATWSVWTSKKIILAGEPVLVIRTDKGYVAYSAKCTHLGCPVSFEPSDRSIVCPCHAAAFDLQGRVTGGPPPYPLPVYNVSEVQGKVWVSL